MFQPDLPVPRLDDQDLGKRCGPTRHEQRSYYYEMDYDWARLDYLCDVYRRVMPMVRRDLDRFRGVLQRTLG